MAIRTRPYDQRDTSNFGDIPDRMYMRLYINKLEETLEIVAFVLIEVRAIPRHKLSFAMEKSLHFFL